jgi:hypothetical protein
MHRNQRESFAKAYIYAFRASQTLESWWRFLLPSYPYRAWGTNHLDYDRGLADL